MTESQKKTLALGWAETSLGELGAYHNGRAFKKSEWRRTGRVILRIQDLTGSRLQPNYFEGEVEPRHEVENGDFLISWAATLGAFIWRGPSAVLNQHIFKVDTHINRLFHFYLVEEALSELKSRSHGSGMVHITKAEFEGTKVWIAPIQEQQRIVEALEVHLTKLNAVK